MGEENTVPMRINGVEGAVGQVKQSGGPGVLETWGTAGGDFPQKQKVNVVRWVIPGWYIQQWGAAGIIAGRMYYTPIFVEETTTYIRIAIEVTIAGAGGTDARLGIYEWDNGLPGDLVLDAGTVDVDGVAIVEIIIAQELTRGYYFLALISDGAPTLTRATASYVGTTPTSGWWEAFGGTGYVIQFANGQAGQVAGGLTDPAVAPINSADANTVYTCLREN